jgi:hypothetical protein
MKNRRFMDFGQTVHLVQSSVVHGCPVSVVHASFATDFLSVVALLPLPDTDSMLAYDAIGI